MNSTQIGWTAFLVAIASLTGNPASALTNQTQPDNQPAGIEGRIARIQSTLKTTAENVPPDATSKPEKIALGWVNGRGGTSFVNASPWRNGGFVNANPWRNGGFVNANPWRNGGFVNVNPWRNGWLNRGGFYNLR